MTLRILNHDYGGYPFVVQLSRILAARGHEVLQVYSASFHGPHTAVRKQETDPATFDALGVELDEPFQKYSFLKRRRQEIEYGRRVAKVITDWRPDVVLSGDTPTEPQRLILRATQDNGGRFIAWVQDIYSRAVREILKRKFPVVGHLAGEVYGRLDRGIMRRSDRVLLITEDFEPVMARWGVAPERIDVVHNWAPLDSLSPCPRSNPWAKEHGLDEGFCFLYSGTLGMKHDPGLLLHLAEHFRDREHVRVVVVAEGPGPDWLREQKTARGLTNLRMLPWQPRERMPEVLGAGDVLLAILRPFAGAFSVPSKVLSYFCAQRPVLASFPMENLAARTIQTAEAGLVTPAGDAAAFVDGAERLVTDEGLRNAMGVQARQYAVARFDIEKIADRFEGILRKALQ